MSKVIAKGRTVKGKLYEEHGALLLNNGKEKQPRVTGDRYWLNQPGIFAEIERWLRRHAMNEQVSFRVMESMNNYVLEISIGKEKR